MKEIIIEAAIKARPEDVAIIIKRSDRPHTALDLEKMLHADAQALYEVLTTAIPSATFEYLRDLIAENEKRFSNIRETKQ